MLFVGRRENKVETYLDDQFIKRGGLTRKYVSPGYVGVPDRIGFLNGRVYLIEVKTIDGPSSPAQIREHKRMKDVGVTVYVVRGQTGVDELMLLIDKGLM